MNKTVNINLAGIFFHIDEDAFEKLQHYLDAIKRSLINTQGKEEIIADIEARIAELFSEKIKNDRQVISIKEVEEVIATMGQPEDYMVDEEIFEDEPSTSYSSKTGKQLFRDTEHSYIGGVSSGLGHYLGIEAVWIRLLWILLTIGSSGAFILIYIALWIFVPEAKTTADKLHMRGEAVNITNIERKIREGFDDVAGKVRSVDYEKFGKQAKSGASSAATGIGAAILTLLNVFVKFIGLLILLVAGCTLIALFIGLFSVGTFGLIDAPWTDYIEMFAIGAPLWVISLLSFFAIGIPFFFLFVLGLKIMVSRLRSIGKPAKLVLLGLWLLSIIALIVLGIRQATEHAFDGEVVTTEFLPVTAKDTVYMSMKNNPNFSSNKHYSDEIQIRHNESDEKVIYSRDVKFVVKSTRDSIGKIEIIKSAQGSDFKDARNRAKNINYSVSLNGNNLQLDSYFTSALQDKYRDQKVKIIVYLPVGSTLYPEKDIDNYHRYSSHEGILKAGESENYLKVLDNETICESCPIESINEDTDAWDDDSDLDSSFNFNDGDDNVQVKIDKDGVRIKKNNEEKVIIDKNGILIDNN